MIVSRFEPLSYMLLNGLVELSFEAWNELEQEHEDIPYSPDWEAYQKKEDENAIRFISLREGGNLIGYASIIVDTEIHRTGVLFASFRDIYITRKKRGYAAQFVRYIEDQLSQIGVKRIWGGERVNAKNNAGKFWKSQGYELQERIYGKTIN